MEVAATNLAGTFGSLSPTQTARFPPAERKGVFCASNDQR